MVARVAMGAVIVGGTMALVGVVAPSAANAGVAVDSNPFTSVSCVNSTFCVAVDEAGHATVYNGTAWSSPKFVDGNSFGGVSCATTTFCVAVDDDGNAFTYNGSTWSSGTSVVDGAALVGISCASPLFCVAVDTGGNADMYNGVSWTLDNLEGFAETTLASVSCPTSSFCVAVDESGDAFTYTGTWSGADDIDNSGSLNSVSCQSASFCAAVDDEGNALTYNGSWSAPIGIDGSNALDAVSCPTSSYCVTVDDVGNADTYDAGLGWAVPVQLDGTNAVSSVSCPTASLCAGVDGAGNALVYGLSSFLASCTGSGLGTFAVPTTVVVTPVAPTSLSAPSSFEFTPEAVFTVPASTADTAIMDGSPDISFDSASFTFDQSGGSAFTTTSQQTSANNLPQQMHFTEGEGTQTEFTFNPLTWTAGSVTEPTAASFTPSTLVLELTSDQGVTITVNCAPNVPNPAPAFTSTTVEPAPVTATASVPSTIDPETAQVTAGNDALWAVPVTNTSTATLSSVSVVATATAPFDSTAMAKSGSSCSASGTDQVTCSLGTIAPSATSTVYAFADTTGLSAGDNVAGTVTVTSNAPTVGTSLGEVDVEVIAGTIATGAAPGEKVANTTAPTSNANPVRIKLKLPKKVLRSSLPAAAQRQLADRPAAKGSLRRVVRASTTVTPPPTATVLGGVSPTSDYLLCPSNTSCVGTLAKVTGNFSNYLDTTHPVAITITYFLGTTNRSVQLWEDEQHGGAAVELSTCTKSGKSYHTPCFTKETFSGSTPHANVTYAVDFVGNDPIFGVRG